MLLALAQTNPRLGQVQANFEAIREIILAARRQGADLLLFPECALPGYCFESREEAVASAVTVPGWVTDTISQVCGSTFVVLGLLEREEDRLYNTAVIMGPSGYLGKYRKTHLPVLGVDRFCNPGEEPAPVFATPQGRFGVLICYELRFPEVARVLALQGADLICNITNWPRGGEANADFIGRTRALENRVYLASCDRTGEERGVHFIGQSQVVDVNGSFVFKAGREEEVFYVHIDLAAARGKSIINKPGEYELHLYRDRRPELYCALTQPCRDWD